MSIRSTNRFQLVRNRAGICAPLSFEKLATNLMTSGVETGLAHEIAASAQQRLLARSDREVESDALADEAEQLLAQRAGTQAADRYRAWRGFKHSGRPVVLCLLGAPGVGKSMAGMQLALRLGLHRVVPTEGLREVMRTLVPDTVLPELHLAAHDASAIQERRECNGFSRQARAVTAAAAAVAESVVRERRSIVLVGSHLVPGAMRAELGQRGCDAVVVELLLTLDDPSLHRGSMLRRARSDPAEPGVRHIQNFDAVRELQDQLRAMARTAGVVGHDLANPEALTGVVVDHILGAAEMSLAAMGSD